MAEWYSRYWPTTIHGMPRDASKRKDFDDVRERIRQVQDGENEDSQDYEVPTSSVFPKVELRPQYYGYEGINETRTFGAKRPESVDISGGVVATQQGLDAYALGHYLANGSNNADRYEEDRPEEPEDEVLNRYPNFVRASGQLYVHHGHHRVAAAMLNDEPEVEGRVLNLDQFRHTRGKQDTEQF